MMSECEIALEPCLAADDEGCGIMFLKTRQGGALLPFTVTYGELSEFTVALEEGKGARPPLARDAIALIEDGSLCLSKMCITGIGPDGICDVILDITDADSGRTVTFDDFDLVCGLFCAIHFGVPVYVEDECAVRWLDSDFSRQAVEAIEKLEEGDD